ncbi:hypothetical protein RBB77_08360 [Tunturibacter psychrotolerans]|uniref:Uncharacterized protein n=1 Tax=Tunturiibacter psychrotolerans TaxID=3069686 RepID=A0AAU7ZVC4_9BACT
MPPKIKFTKQYKPMGFGDRDDRGSVEAHLRSVERAKEMRQLNRRLKELEARGRKETWWDSIEGNAFLLFKAWDTMMEAAGLMNPWRNDLPAELSMVSLAAPTYWLLWKSGPFGVVRAVWTSQAG